MDYDQLDATLRVDAQERNPDVLRAEMSLLTTRSSAEYSAEAYAAIQNVQAQCAADIKNICSDENIAMQNRLVDDKLMSRRLASEPSGGMQLIKAIQSLYRHNSDNLVDSSVVPRLLKDKKPKEDLKTVKDASADAAAPALKFPAATTNSGMKTLKLSPGPMVKKVGDVDAAGADADAVPQRNGPANMGGRGANGGRGFAGRGAGRGGMVGGRGFAGGRGSEAAAESVGLAAQEITDAAVAAEDAGGAAGPAGGPTGGRGFAGRGGPNGRGAGGASNNGRGMGRIGGRGPTQQQQQAPQPQLQNQLQQQQNNLPALQPGLGGPNKGSTTVPRGQVPVSQQTDGNGVVGAIKSIFTPGVPSKPIATAGGNVATPGVATTTAAAPSTGNVKSAPIRGRPVVAANPVIPATNAGTPASAPAAPEAVAGPIHHHHSSSPIPVAPVVAATAPSVAVADAKATPAVAAPGKAAAAPTTSTSATATVPAASSTPAIATAPAATSSTKTTAKPVAATSTAAAPVAAGAPAATAVAPIAAAPHAHHQVGAVPAAPVAVAAAPAAFVVPAAPKAVVPAVAANGKPGAAAGTPAAAAVPNDSDVAVRPAAEQGGPRLRGGHKRPNGGGATVATRRTMQMKPRDWHHEWQQGNESESEGSDSDGEGDRHRGPPPPSEGRRPGCRPPRHLAAGPRAHGLPLMHPHDHGHDHHDPHEGEWREDEPPCEEQEEGEQGGWWHHPPPPPEEQEDLLYNGALGYGPAADLCMHQHYEQLSAPCSEAIDNLYQVREQYWQSAQMSPPHPHCHGFLLLLAGVVLFCGVRRWMHRGRIQKFRTFMNAIRSNEALKATIEKETGLAVPEPPCAAHKKTWKCRLACAVALGVALFLAVDITGHILHHMDERAMEQGTAPSTPGKAIAIILGVLSLEILTMVGVVKAAKCIRSRFFSGSSVTVEPSAPIYNGDGYIPLSQGDDQESAGTEMTTMRPSIASTTKMVLSNGSVVLVPVSAAPVTSVRMV